LNPACDLRQPGKQQDPAAAAGPPGPIHPDWGEAPSPCWMVKFPVTVPVAELRLMAMYVT